MSKSSLYQNVIQQFDKAADQMGLDEDIRKILSNTVNEITVNFPVRMDDGRIEMFTAYRVQHNNVLGPFKGGLRYHPAVDIDEEIFLSAEQKGVFRLIHQNTLRKSWNGSLVDLLMHWGIT
jgi:glutamate dehydrogenase/leucine dehydrogenase